MGLAHAPTVVDELSPEEAFAALSAGQSAALIDVRTRAEWAFIGVPDISGTGKPLWTIEWVTFPTMQPNGAFIDQLAGEAGGSMPDHLLFICRSGARSMAAAQAVASMCAQMEVAVRCTNVAEGFEGDLDGNRQRGRHNGWKARGLPWHQS